MPSCASCCQRATNPGGVCSVSPGRTSRLASVTTASGCRSAISAIAASPQARQSGSSATTSDAVENGHAPRAITVSCQPCRFAIGTSAPASCWVCESPTTTIRRCGASTGWVQASIGNRVMGTQSQFSIRTQSS
jgi:hypothetical protein